MSDSIEQLNEWLQQMRRHRASKKQEINDLRAKYPGVRPGSVSADLAWLGMELNSAEMRITEIEETIAGRMQVDED
jgi:hypothetical protein